MNHPRLSLYPQSACHARAFRTNPNRGFTLVEVLLSLWIMSIMALMSWQSIDGMVRAREQSLSSVNQISMIQTALAQWQTDLDQALSSDSNSQLPALNWDGQTLKWVRSSSASWNAQGDPGLWVVAWTLRSLSPQDPTPAFSKLNTLGSNGFFWMRWQSPAFKTQDELNRYWLAASNWGKNASAEEKAFETILIPIQNWQIYYYRLNAWSNPLSSTSSTLSTSNTSITSSDMASNLNTTQVNGSSTSSTINNSTAPSTLAMPDGIRLKLSLSPTDALGGSPSTGNGSGANAPLASLTLDWVRPNFSNPR